MVEGLEDPGRWIGDTDPKRHGKAKIVVSGEDVSHAVVKKTVLERAIDGVKVIAGNFIGKSHRAHKGRHRAVSAATSASASVESVASHGASSASTLGRDKISNPFRRASLRGDEITTALKASRDGDHHPLAQSQIAGAADEDDSSYFNPHLLSRSGQSSSAGCSPLSENERIMRPPGPERVLSALSTAESTRTVRAPQPKPGRSSLIDTGQHELHTSNLFEATATSIGNIFSGAGKRLSGIRSRERRPLDSSRSSSAEGRSPEGIGHAEPIVAVSNATASGKVTTPEALRATVDPLEEVPSQLSPSSPQPRRFSLFQPPSSSTEAFERAQDANARRQKLDADIDAERAASRLERRQPGLDCPPSPDDDVYHAGELADVATAPLHMALSNQPSASTIASSAVAENGGISQSTSHPSFPSIESGASSIYPDESMRPYKAPLTPLGEIGVQPLMNKGQHVLAHDKPATMPADGVLQSGSSIGELLADDDGSSDDEGLTFGRPRKRSTMAQKTT